jgi:dTMP kinase
MTARGKYICLEGGDGTGKSKLADALRDKLIALSISVFPMRFPSDGEVGKLIRSGLMGDKDLEEKSYLYLFAADGLNEESTIQLHLNEGHHVICDRHPTLSGRVFQPKHHPESHIEAVYDSAAADGISMPDFLFVLDMPVEGSLARMSGREKYKDVVFEEDNLDKLRTLRERYHDIAYRFKGVLIDASLSTEELAELVMDRAGLR